MAQLQTGNTRTFVAGVDLSASQYCIAKLDTAVENQVNLATAASDPIAGVIDGFGTTGKAGDTVVIRKGGFSAKVIASAAISIGDKVTATTAGQAVTTTNGGDFLVGRALQAAAAQGDVIEIELIMAYL